MTDTLTTARPDVLPVPEGASDEVRGWIEGIYGDGDHREAGARSRASGPSTWRRTSTRRSTRRSRVPRGAVGRGRRRFYVEIHPEQLRGFVELVDHPWVRGVCEAVLGADYQIVELGFDIPFPGALDQPWHRDFRMPEETKRTGRARPPSPSTSRPSTPSRRWGRSRSRRARSSTCRTRFDHEMFPPKDSTRATRSARCASTRRWATSRPAAALTIHHGTKNVSSQPRPVLVLGVDAPGAGNAEHHDMAVTQGFYDSLPQRVRDHLVCPIVDELPPIEQKHDIEGLMMGDA